MASDEGVATDSAATDSPESVPADSAASGGGRFVDRARRYGQRFSYTGAVLATVFLWLSATPSLLPRGPLFQGAVSAGSAGIGYMLGAFLAWLVRYMLSRDTPWRRPGRAWWIGLGVVFAIGTVTMMFWFHRWQDEIRDLMGVERLSWTAYPTVVIVAVVVFVIVLAIGQAIGAATRALFTRMSKRIPPRISAVATGVVVAILAVLVFNGVIANYGMKALNSTFAAVNDETNPDSEPPTSTLRSGGPGSLVSWESLGRMGRSFVSSGPTVAELTEFNGTPAMEPIRAYAGLQSADSIEASAELAARELERTGGLERKLIAVASTTGTGWINRANTDSLEYMFNGDTAIVSMQYSTLPSWLSFLVDQERARQAGRALFEAVDRLVRRIPEAERPRIVVFGESLGSFAAEAPFGSIPTLAARTDGALLTGPTFSNELWRETTNNRDAGSPEWLPIYQDGDYVRFIADADDMNRPVGKAWENGRIVYLQHPSDPITWWSPDLILNKPDWLEEERGRDVVGATRWIPFVTFLQVAADMAVSVNVPDGHGHTFLAAIPKAWAKILEPEGWTPADTERLLPRLTRD